MSHRGWHLPVLFVVALGLLLLLDVAPAGAAVCRVGSLNCIAHRVSPPGVRNSPEPQLVWGGGLGPGENINGFLPAEKGTFNPVTERYPAGDPTSDEGFEPSPTEFAGIIIGVTTGESSQNVDLYCIDIRTFTYPGFGYIRGTWNEANVPNVGYVARILHEYYPEAQQAEPAS